MHLILSVPTLPKILGVVDALGTQHGIGSCQGMGTAWVHYTWQDQGMGTAWVQQHKIASCQRMGTTCMSTLHMAARTKAWVLCELLHCSCTWHGRGDLPQEILKSSTSNGGILGLFRTRLTMKCEHVFRYLTMQNVQYAFVGRTIGIRKMNSSESHLI